MKKRFLSVLLGTALASVVLAGCSGGDAKQADGPASGDTGGSLVYWSMWDAPEPQGQAIKAAVEKFTADTGVTVDLQFKGRNGIREGLQPALDAGTNIDLFDEDIDRVNTTWGKYLMDLEDLVGAADYEATANAGLMAACRDVGGGTLKSIPYQPNVFAFFYNQSIFDEAGITKVPETWEELDAACQKIKDAGYTPITSDDAYITCLFGYHMSRLIGEAKTQEIVNEGKWDDPAVLKMAQAYEDFAKKDYFSDLIASNVWPSAQLQELAAGTAAMYLNGSWLPNEVKDAAGPDFKWGCFSYPAVDGGVDGTNAANYGAQVLAINKESKNAESAFKLIQYITQGEFDQMMSELSVGIPADSRNTEWPAMLECVKPVMESLTDRYTWAAGAEANPDMTPIIKENVLKLCSGTMTAQEFVDTMKNASK